MKRVKDVQLTAAQPIADKAPPAKVQTQEVKGAKPNSRLIVKNLPRTLDERSLKKKFDEFGEVTDCQIMFKGEVNRGFAFVGFRDINCAIAAKDRLNNNFIGSSKITVDFAVEKSQEKPVNKGGKQQAVAKKQEQTSQVAISANNSAPQNNTNGSVEVDEKRIYVTNLPYSVTDADLAAAFAKCGNVASAKVIVKNGQSCGYGFVTFEDGNGSIRALADMDKKTVFGRSLGVSQCRKQSAKPEQQQHPAQLNAPSAEKSSFKKLKKQKLLDRLHDDTNWNSTFLNPNTIMERMSEKLGVSRKALLDNDIENPAVIKAVCEREVLEEVNAYLTAHGINLDAFKDTKQATKRSKTTLFVKNLPYKSKEQKVQELFSQYGKIDTFLMAPNRAIAVISFSDETHAQNAFKSLSEYVFQGVPLYLEWAPQGVLQPSESKPESGRLTVDEVPETEELEGANLNTVYIKNLNLDTEEDAIEEMLQEGGLVEFKFVKIIRKEGKSLGYGFVEFERPDLAQKMIKKFQNHLLDSHALKLSISKPRQTDSQTAARTDEESKPSDKLLLKNLPFQTNKAELTALVRSLTSARDVRLPKKTDGSLKGYAFVQFASVDECKKAFEALRNLHFYGRKLVPMYAKE